ncbi:MAG TPA: hypothetical protein VF215_11410 [Thermoanaerobaculia bacterium]
MTAMGAVMVLVLVTLSVCCMAAPLFAQQHGCCKGRCASMSAAVPFVALAEARQRVSIVSLAAVIHPGTSDGTSPLRILEAATGRSRLFAPIDTIQLRI